MVTDSEIRRRAKEHAAAMQHYFDAGTAVCATMAKLGAGLDPPGDAWTVPDSYANKADYAAGQIGSAYRACYAVFADITPT